MGEQDISWKTKMLVGATLLGAITGLSAGYLLSRSAEESGEGPPEIHTADVLRLVIGVVGLVRGVAALGERK